MWPFRKKALEEIKPSKSQAQEEIKPSKSQAQEEIKPSKSQAQIDELVAFRKIGEKFNYMGVEIIVTSHKKLIPAGFCFVWEPCLSGDYKNNQGEIKSISFNYSELEALKAENRAASSKYLKDYLSGTLSGDGDS